MPDLQVLLVAVALVALVALVYLLERRYPGPSKPREWPFLLTYCTWCIHRDGDDCTHAESLVSGQECAPACIGADWCEVREVKQ